jgi:hypothetical protein
LENSLKVLVCGGRDYNDDVLIYKELDKLGLRPLVDMIIHGGARGVDSIAGWWADSLDIPCLRVPADWRIGKAAGFYRNKHMLTYQPDLVLAFPGGKGTANMVQLAREAGLRVTLVPSPESYAVVSEEENHEG